MVRFFSAVVLLLVSVSAITSASDDKNTDPSSYTFVIVHGASGGAWDWKIVGNILADKGHTVYRPTLTGLGEKYHLANPDINLTTHINDIVNVILFENLTDVVLVGHSYGGMVITGVMDRIPERINHVTFLDAKVPADGMSMFVDGKIPENFKIEDGQMIFPWMDEKAPFPRDVRQSLKTFTEPVSYNNPAALKINATYIAFLPDGMTVEERAKDPSWPMAEKRGWTMRVADGDHVFYRERPQVMADLIALSASDLNK